MPWGPYSRSHGEDGDRTEVSDGRIGNRVRVYETQRASDGVLLCGRVVVARGCTYGVARRKEQ